MDFAIDERAEGLRAEAREFLREHFTREIRARVLENGDWHDREFHGALARRGWIGVHWPPEDGGRGWDRADHDVLYEEMASAGAPLEGLAVTLIVADTIRRVGTAEQEERLLKPICRGEVILSLGYTEPDAGSDLAAVRTRAVKDGTEWIINGQKNFTTLGHLADYVFLLARTDPEAPKHAGLTIFLVPTSSVGFSVTPVRTLSGQRTNLTFYGDVRVGDEARVGEVGQGWEIVNVALAFERGGEFAAQLRRLVNAAATWGRDSGQTGDPRFLSRLGRVAASAEVARLLGAKASWRRSGARAGAVEGAMAKVYATDALVRDSRTMLDTAGVRGLLGPNSPGAPADGELQQIYRESQIATLYGGTNEVLRGVIAQGRLGLPRSRRN